MVLVGVVDRTSAIPLHMQLSRLLELLVVLRLAPGERLPSINRTAFHYGVARPTVRRALETLSREGLVSRQTQGVFVRADR